MATNKYKMTGFTRFFLFMLFFIPAVLAGVSYAKYGKVDLSLTGVSNLLKDQPIDRSPELKIQQLESDIEELEDEIEDKKREIESLRDQVN